VYFLAIFSSFIGWSHKKSNWAIFTGFCKALLASLGSLVCLVDLGPVQLKSGQLGGIYRRLAGMYPQADNWKEGLFRTITEKHNTDGLKNNG
jgi:hypothetical protein